MSSKKSKASSSSSSSRPVASSSNLATSQLRSTEMIPLPTASSSSTSRSPTFTVATWNVLADSHTYPHYYPHCSRTELNWSHRFQLLESRIQEVHADILCLQEVDNWKDFDNALGKLGYTSIYLARGGDKHDGCSISYKTDKFLLIDQLQVYLNDISDYPFKDAQRINKNCVALGLVLRPAEMDSDSSLDFLIVTTHLFWNPKFEDVKTRQIQYLTYCVSEYWPHPNRLILCGDFNSTPDSAVATMLRTGHVDMTTWDIKTLTGRNFGGKCEGWSTTYGLGGSTSRPGKSQSSSSSEVFKYPTSPEEVYAMLKDPVLRHPFTLRSVYQHYEKHMKLLKDAPAKLDTLLKEPKHLCSEPITSHFTQFSGTLDYIFISPCIKARAYLRIPTVNEFIKIGHLPRNEFASDHVLLMAELCIEPEPKK